MTEHALIEPSAASRPPQVSIISHYYPPYPCGGGERQAQCIAETLAAQGWQMQVLTKQIPGAPKQETLNGVQVRRLWASPVPKTQLAQLTFDFLGHLLAGPRGQVVHLNQMYRDILPALMARRLRGSPIVVSLMCGGANGDIAHLLRKPGGKRLVQLHRRADVIVSLSQQITDELLEQGFEREQIIEIPNSVDVRRFTPVSAEEKARLRRELHLPLDAQLVICVARLHYQKGHDTLLRAWKEVSQAHPRAHLLLAGHGPEEEKLKTLAADLDLGASLHFLGHVEPSLPYVQAADVFVLPSFFEGVPLALLEGMSCALPVVTTNIGGTREVIRPEVDGLLVEPGDVPALAAALTQVLGDAALAQRLGTEARRRVEANYRSDLIVSRYAAVYTRLAVIARKEHTSPDAQVTQREEAKAQ